MTGYHSTEGAHGHVHADTEQGLVVIRFTDPSTGELAVEVRLNPETAWDMASRVAKAAVSIESGGVL